MGRPDRFEVDQPAQMRGRGVHRVEGPSQTFIGGNNELALPQIIMLQIGRRADFPMAAALSIILMLTVTLAYAACARWLKIERA